MLHVPRVYIRIKLSDKSLGVVVLSALAAVRKYDAVTHVAIAIKVESEVGKLVECWLVTAIDPFYSVYSAGSPHGRCDGLSWIQSSERNASV